MNYHIIPYQLCLNVTYEMNTCTTACDTACCSNWTNCKSKLLFPIFTTYFLYAHVSSSLSLTGGLYALVVG